MRDLKQNYEKVELPFFSRTWISKMIIFFAEFALVKRFTDSI